MPLTHTERRTLQDIAYYLQHGGLLHRRAQALGDDLHALLERDAASHQPVPDPTTRLPLTARDMPSERGAWTATLTEASDVLVDGYSGTTAILRAILTGIVHGGSPRLVSQVSAALRADDTWRCETIAEAGVNVTARHAADDSDSAQADLSEDGGWRS